MWWKHKVVPNAKQLVRICIHFPSLGFWQSVLSHAVESALLCTYLDTVPSTARLVLVWKQRFDHWFAWFCWIYCTWTGCPAAHVALWYGRIPCPVSSFQSVFYYLPISAYFWGDFVSVLCYMCSSVISLLFCGFEFQVNFLVIFKPQAEIQYSVSCDNLASLDEYWFTHDEVTGLK